MPSTCHPSVPYGWALPKLLLTLLVAYTYMIIAPLCVPVALAIFIVHNTFFRYLIVWNHMPHYESGGMFWYMTFHRIILGLTLSNCFVILAVYLKTDPPHSQALVMMPLPIACYMFGEYARHAYEIPSKSPARYDSVEQDKMIKRLQMMYKFDIFDQFKEYLYAQPSVQHSIQFEKQRAMGGFGVSGAAEDAGAATDAGAAAHAGAAEGADGLKRPSQILSQSAKCSTSPQKVQFSEEEAPRGEGSRKLRPPSMDANSPRSRKVQKAALASPGGGKMVPVRSLNRRGGGRNNSKDVDDSDPPTIQL